MRAPRCLLPLLTALAATPAAAQTVVTSPRPDAVAVTVYRNPDRDPGTLFDLDWLQGYALVTETRRIAIPAGESVVRFEGVASGAFAETAIVTGFPDAIIERNRDAELLSARTLLDRSLARHVHLRRTSLATGTVREEDAVIRSGADGAVVLQTAQGFEALRCTGLPEAIVYDGVPAGLNARPTLSVRLRAAAPATATVTLAYLAAGFDWQANYVGTLSPDGRRLELFAWLTLASMDDTSFPDASAQAVAGQPNREPQDWRPPEQTGLALRCWPQGRTNEGQPGTIAMEGLADEQAIVVTGSRIRAANLNSLSPVTAVTAERENLGDLKLYRIPVPVTVAAHAQKQVALMHREGVEVRQVYRRTVGPEDADDGPVAAEWVLLTRNRAAQGLGLPLPAGRLILFGAGASRPVMLGAGAIRDYAEGEEVELPFGAAEGVMTTLRLVGEGEERRTYELAVSNDHARPLDFEAQLDFPHLRRGHGIVERDGRQIWRRRLPANGTARLRFTVPSS